MSDFVCGANEAGFHLTGVNFGRDLPSRRWSATCAMSSPATPRPTARAGWNSVAASKSATSSSCAQVRRGAEMLLPRRKRAEPGHGNGLLRHRRHPHRRRRHRAGARRARHHLPGRDRALRGVHRADGLRQERSRQARRPTALYAELVRPASTSCSTTATKARG
jgi:hypothetical protein